ncbi:hypothetical protein CHKEEEPN_1633 [Methylorubrum podarium]|nr:hypothetical protein CHKEEEPN_1633 [Methylorubrum podarium]
MTSASILDVLRALTETPAALTLSMPDRVAEVASRAKLRPTTAPTLVTVAPTVVTAFLISEVIVAFDFAETLTRPVALIGWPEIEAVAAKVLAPWIVVPRSVPTIASERSNRTFWLDVPILLKAAVTPTAVSEDSTMLLTVAVIVPAFAASTVTLPTVRPAPASPSFEPMTVAVLDPVTTLAAITAPTATAPFVPGLVPGFSLDSTLLVTDASIVPVCVAATVTSPARVTLVFLRVASAVERTSFETRMPLTATA